jgi:membrane-bound serine protease (ClpP class)
MVVMKNCCFVLAFVFLLSVVGLSQVQTEIWHLTIDSTIDQGTVSYLKAGLSQAAQAEAAAVIIEFSTPGGYLDAARACRDVILDSSLTTIAFVNREAYSAGALLAIACQRVYFDPAGVMGAATPVYFQSGRAEEASEKEISAVRSLFRATAEFRGRQPKVAEAMVDRDVEIEGLIDRGKLLTLTANEAETWGYSDGIAEEVAELLTKEGLDHADVKALSYRWVDKALQVITSPWVAGLLITVGVLGLIVEMMIPGFGIAGVLGLAGLGTFFWSHFYVGLSGWESLAFFIGGLVAILLEIFVFTAADFGLAGLAGLFLIGLGFYSSMVGPFTGPEQVTAAILSVSLGLVVVLVLSVFLLMRLPRSKLRFGGVILSSVITGRAFDKTGSRKASPWVGREGIALTDLRPVGAADFSGERVDVSCEEGYLPKGTLVVIVGDEGYRKVVKRLKEAK